MMISVEHSCINGISVEKRRAGRVGVGGGGLSWVFIRLKKLIETKYIPRLLSTIVG